MISIKLGAILIWMPYLFWIPGYCANSFSAHVVQRQALLLGLDVPDGYESSTATSDHNVCNLLVPVQTFNVICAGRIVAQSERVLDVVEVGDEKLALCATAGQQV